MEPSETRRSSGAGRFVLVGALVFLLAILTARVTLDETWGWAAAAIAIPVLLVVVRFAVGWAGAAVLVGFYAALILFLRAVLSNPKVGPAIVLLLGVFALSALLAGRVAVGLLVLRREAKARPKDQA